MMMKGRKWFLGIFLAASLALASCGGQTNSGADGVTESQTEEAAGDETDEADAYAALKEQMGFYVEGTTLYDANGNPFVMRGVNHAYAWYADKLFLTLDGVKEIGGNTIRVVLSNGEQWERNTPEAVRALIQFCKERDLIAVLEVHDATGYTDKESLIAAAQYFVDIKDVLIGEEDYVIINIANEWQGNSEYKLWEEAYTEAIPMLREAGLAHTIMVDCSGWGQYAQCMEKAGQNVFDSDPLGNVMFSVHMYGTAGGSVEKIETNLKYATDQNLCVCVGEFGYMHTDGDVDEAFLMQYCTENDIGYLAWSWKGNGEEVAYLDLVGQWDGDEPSADWGVVVFDGENGIRATSKICTVFEEQSE